MKIDVSFATASKKMTDMCRLMHLHVIPPLRYEAVLEPECDYTFSFKMMNRSNCSRSLVPPIRIPIPNIDTFFYSHCHFKISTGNRL